MILKDVYAEHSKLLKHYNVLIPILKVLPCESECPENAVVFDGFIKDGMNSNEKITKKLDVHYYDNKEIVISDLSVPSLIKCSKASIGNIYKIMRKDCFECIHLNKTKR